MKTNRYSLIEQDLKAGYQFKVTTIDKEQELDADISFESRFNKFYIWFNGKLIHTCVTFKSVISRLDKLNSKFPLEDGSALI